MFCLWKAKPSSVRGFCRFPLWKNLQGFEQFVRKGGPIVPFGAFDGARRELLSTRRIFREVFDRIDQGSQAVRFDHLRGAKWLEHSLQFAMHISNNWRTG